MVGRARTEPKATEPRWEWRAFDVPPDEAARLVEEDASAEETEETYLLGGPRGNAKLRGGLLDVKVLRDVDALGLERWEPILKAVFPVPRDEVARALEALDAPTVDLARDAFTVDGLLDEAARRGIRSLAVEKRRRRATVEGCMAEVVEVRAGDRASTSVAVESADAEAVARVVRAHGWDPVRNTSYPSGLAVLATGRVAIIDVGTNSVKFHVAERSPRGWRSLVDRAEVTRLGDGLELEGRIDGDASARTATAIADMAAEARELGAPITAVGTAALRRATDRDEVLGSFRQRAGVDVEIISGDEEGRLAFLGVGAALPQRTGSLVVFDTGGGSTEFTFGRDGAVEDRVSTDVGAVTLTTRFGLEERVDDATIASVTAALEHDLSLLTGRDSPDVLVGMGGTVTNLVAVSLAMAEYDPDAVQAAELRYDEVARQIERYRSLDAAGRRAIVGLQPARAEVILGGACIVGVIMSLTGRDVMIASDRGLRHGLLVDRFGAGVAED